MESDRLESISSSQTASQSNEKAHSSSLFALLKEHGTDKPKSFRSPQPRQKREPFRKKLTPDDTSSLSFMSATRAPKKNTSLASLFVPDPLDSKDSLAVTKEEQAQLQILPLSFPFSPDESEYRKELARKNTGLQTTEMKIALQQEKNKKQAQDTPSTEDEPAPDNLMPDVLPFLSSAESSVKKEQHIQSLLDQRPVPTQGPIPSVTPSGAPPSSRTSLSPPPASSTPFSLASSSPPPVQSSPSTPVSSPSPVPGAAAAPAPLVPILIPDTLPPTPIIGTGAGVVGKLKVTKSGKAFFEFGDTKLWVQKGADCVSLQHLVYVDDDSRTLEKLGDIRDKYVVVPDLDSMMGMT